MLDSKAKRILKYMEKHPKKGISQMEAVEMFQAYRLSSVIFDLKRQGYDIATQMCEGRIGIGGRRPRFARYFLKQC